jgi:hypothetical protein
MNNHQLFTFTVTRCIGHFVCSSISSFFRFFLLAGGVAVEYGFVVPRPVSSMKPSPMRSCFRRPVIEIISIPMNEINNACIIRPWMMSHIPYFMINQSKEGSYKRSRGCRGGCRTHMQSSIPLMVNSGRM